MAVFLAEEQMETPFQVVDAPLISPAERPSPELHDGAKGMYEIGLLL